MKRLMLSLCLLVEAGCVQFNESKPSPVQPPGPLAPVSKDLGPEQINALNARAVADMLCDQWALDAQEMAVSTKKAN